MAKKAKATVARGPKRPAAKQARPAPGPSTAKSAKPVALAKKVAVSEQPKQARPSLGSRVAKGPPRPGVAAAAAVAPAAPPRSPPRVLTPLPPINTGDPERDAAERRAREIEVRLQSRGIREAQARARKVSGGWRLVLEIPLEAADRIAPR